MGRIDTAVRLRRNAPSGGRRRKWPLPYEELRPAPRPKADFFSTSVLLGIGLVLGSGAGTAWAPEKAAEDQKPVAVIVNIENPFAEISLRELKDIFKLSRTSWGKPFGERAVVFLGSGGTLEKNVALDVLYGMTAEELERYWLEKVYQGEITSPPQAIRSGRAVQAVAREKGGIGLIPTADLTDELRKQVKVIKVDGWEAGQADYPLVGKRP